MNTGIPFTRWSSHHRDTGAQKILSGHLEKRGAAAKQARERVSQTGIDLLAGIFESAASLSIALSNRLLQSIERLDQVLML